MKVSLVIGNGKHSGKVILLTRKQFVIGRHRKCEMCVTSSRVSVHHCAVLIRGESAWLRDFDSTNGTYVNDEIIKGDRQLRHGDVLRIGSLVLEVQLEAGQIEGRVRALSEKAAARVMHENSWSDMGDGVLSPAPASHYGVTEFKIPPVTDNDLPSRPRICRP
jgi:pSer/pThr/pTyr-binding forkhead associated (FHA) protein